MKALFSVAAAAALLCTQSVFAEELEAEGFKVVGDVTKEAVMAYRGSIKPFIEELQAELKAGIKQGGPVAAIGICNTKATAIATDVSEKYNWDLSRTSLKYRNPSNKPDAWEQVVLEYFEAQKAAGADITQLEYAKMLETADGKREIRYMKAIPTAGLCLACHGAEVTPEVEARLKELYPEDKARGYKEGDIRGAFSFVEVLAE